MDLGQVITIIGLCPSKPAEFVIFRLKQTRFGGDVEE
jgi:phage tail sheath protein FI